MVDDSFWQLAITKAKASSLMISFIFLSFRFTLSPGQTNKLVATKTGSIANQKKKHYTIQMFCKNNYTRIQMFGINDEIFKSQKFEMWLSTRIILEFHEVACFSGVFIFFFKC